MQLTWTLSLCTCMKCKSDPQNDHIRISHLEAGAAEVWDRCLASLLRRAGSPGAAVLAEEAVERGTEVGRSSPSKVICTGVSSTLASEQNHININWDDHRHAFIRSSTHVTYLLMRCRRLCWFQVHGWLISSLQSGYGTKRRKRRRGEYYRGETWSGWGDAELWWEH